MKVTIVAESSGFYFLYCVFTMMLNSLQVDATPVDHILMLYLSYPSRLSKIIFKEDAKDRIYTKKRALLVPSSIEPISGPNLLLLSSDIVSETKITIAYM